jgi:SpoVK/Ycf46/Vps4 family AAA+-type ATPase
MVKSMVDEEIGIIVLTDRYTLKTVRKAKSKLENLDKEALFNMLRKDEYLKIIKQLFGHIPDVPNTKIYTASKDIFCSLSVELIHKEVLRALKARKNHINLIDNIKKFPNSLKIAIIESNLSIQQQDEFLKILNTKVNKVFTKETN